MMISSVSKYPQGITIAVAFPVGSFGDGTGGTGGVLPVHHTCSHREEGPVMIDVDTYLFYRPWCVMEKSDDV